MAVQHNEIKKLRSKGMISSVWTPSQVALHVNDNYTNATVANHSACPCGKSAGYHCTINSASHRFVRLGNGQYCLPEESPDICPIHNAKSVLASNPYVIQFPPAKESATLIGSEPSHGSEDSQMTNTKQRIRQLIIELRDSINQRTLNDDLVSQFSKRLFLLGFSYRFDVYPPLKETENFDSTVKDSPHNLAEALLWKLGKWKTYMNFVKYYEEGESTTRGTDIIFYAFARHLRDRSQPIIDQHTIRSMWAVDSTLTQEEKESCKKFLIARNGKWKSSGSGRSGSECYHCYVRFANRLANLGVDIAEADRLLMPLGQALKKLAKSYEDFRRLCELT